MYKDVYSLRVWFIKIHHDDRANTSRTMGSYLLEEIINTVQYSHCLVGIGYLRQQSCLVDVSLQHQNHYMGGLHFRNLLDQLTNNFRKYLVRVDINSADVESNSIW